jgi:hypothetical protein
MTPEGAPIRTDYLALIVLSDAEPLYCLVGKLPGPATRQELDGVLEAAERTLDDFIRQIAGAHTSSFPAGSPLHH